MQKFKDIRWKWLEEKGIKPQGDRLQVEYLESLWAKVDEVEAVFMEAKAGTGKTALATLAGAYDVIGGEYDKIIYIRNAVSLREQGFLPGDQGEKDSPYMAPIADTLELLGSGTFEEWSIEKEDDGVRLKCMTTAFVRGITWDNALIIVDEAQNFDLEELQAVYTRKGKNSKMVTVGSKRQVDNKKIKRIHGLLPFEIYMEHFKGDEKVRFHTLETCYRGWFADKADDIQDTVDRLRKEAVGGE